MNLLRNMKIRVKLLASFVLVIALIVALVALASVQMRRVRDSYATVIRHPLSIETTLREFDAEFHDLRRIVTAIAFSIGQDVSHERRFSEADAAYVQANAHLDKARTLVLGNPALTNAEKDARLASSDALRDAMRKYHDAVILPVVQSARAGDREAAHAIAHRASSAAGVVMERIDDAFALASLAARNQAQRAEDDSEATITLLMVISSVAVLAAVGIALIASNYVGRALTPLTECMHRAATVGDIAVTPEWAGVVNRIGRNQDELGRTVVAASAFFRRIGEISDSLNKVAIGDLTSGVRPLSNRDLMGLALARMQKNLGSLCGAIDAAVAHVATGTNQVMTGAQTLAAGSSEQAASIEEISESIAAIAERTKHAVHMAQNTAGVAETIKDRAESTRSRMDDMLIAARQIGEAGTTIRAVVKMMDEIAFQTHVLSMNAAIEAARAGVHGRGFAIVANAVRELAARSAGAAKETGRLINDSLEKTELGVHIAGEASSSLAEILSGIAENSQLVSQLAAFAEAQSLSIEEINLSLSQVSDIVQKNSVAAEESAAASEEISHQSASLQRLVMQFTLDRADAAVKPVAGVGALGLARAPYRMSLPGHP